MIILLPYVEAHIFILETLDNFLNLLSYKACSTIIHSLMSCRLDYCNSLLCNVPMHKTDRLQILQNQYARILTKLSRGEHITPVLKTYIGSKCRIESLIKYVCSHINRTTILHRLIYVN